MVTYVPFAIFFGAVATAALIFYSLWDPVQRKGERTVGSFTVLLDRAGLRRSPEEWVATLITVTAVLWILTVLLLRPNLLVGLLLLPAAAAATGAGFAAYVQFQLKRRTERFVQQLEVALRLLGSGLRIGLGLRQSLAMVIDEMPDPARHEFSRVIGQTNIGASVHDALDDLATRMGRNESLMMSRVIRVQSQAGGDLASILEHLANTIKERRRMYRKISALTAEGRAGAVVLLAIPLCLGAFICFSQKQMGHALLFTQPGHIALGIVVVLEVLGALTISRILKVNV